MKYVGSVIQFLVANFYVSRNCAGRILVWKTNLLPFIYVSNDLQLFSTFEYEIQATSQ